MSAHATPAPSGHGLRTAGVALRLPVVEADAAYGAALGAVLAWVAIRGNGGLRTGDTTAVEIGVDLLAGIVAAVALLTVPLLRRRAPGMAAAVAFGLLAAATVVSTIWSITPNQSWLEANRQVTYLAAFGTGMALVRLAPHRWAALVYGITTASLLVSAYALAHKAFPGQLAADEVYARLRQPFGYWNAVGLMAALGLPGCLWLGARRTGHGAVNALAYPATGLLVVVMLLSYSRGSLLAAASGAIVWFAAVPLRLRGFAVLATGTAGAVAVIAWAFSRAALTEDRIALPARDAAGHQLAIAMVFMLAALLVAGMLVNFLIANRPPGVRTRRQAGTAILVALCLVPVALAGALALSDRGLGGSISHGWTALTDPNASTPSNAPGRLTAVGSVRARYWNEALKIFVDHPVAGVGAGGYAVARLRYRNDNLDVQHAHGYVVQVLADRGAIGLLLSLAALAAVAVAVGQATGLRPGGGALRTTPERVGLITLLAVIVTFGVHSFVDWSWFIPGVSIPALLAGGWLAGRGPLELPARGPERLLARLRRGLQRRARLVAAAAAMTLALVAAWAAWQPQRSIDAGNAALQAAAHKDFGRARELAHTAQRRDPLATDPLFVEAAVEQAAGDKQAAFRALQDAVRRQPADPTTWTRLAGWQLHQLGKPADARRTLAAALYLNPRSPDAIGLLLEADRALAAKR